MHCFPCHPRHDALPPLPAHHTLPPRPPSAQVDLSCIYEGPLSGQRVYSLRTLVGFSAAQHVAIVQEQGSGWVVLDSAQASAVGGWADVQQLCVERGLQPVLLVYDRLTAPRE